MTIEFQTPYGKVPEDLLNFARKELMELFHIQKKISRAEVVFREDNPFIPGDNKVCEISLSIFGASLFARSCTNSFDRSARAVIKDLNRLVKKQVKQRKLSGQIAV